jgi:uncharacterized protein (DUF924 family)
MEGLADVALCVAFSSLPFVMSKLGRKTRPVGLALPPAEEDNEAGSVSNSSVASCVAPPAYAEVYDYWFKGSASVNYKTKWFPSSSGGAQRRADVLVKGRYGHLLEAALRGELDHWAEEDKRGRLALVIVLDQFSRHVFRHDELDAGHGMRKAADALALAHSERLVGVEGWSDDMSTYEFAFALMPYRHSNGLSRLQFVMDVTQLRLGQEEGALKVSQS